MINFEEYEASKPFFIRLKDKIIDKCVPAVFWRIKYKMHNIYYGIKNHQNFVYTGLPLSCWYDIDIRMLYANMNLLVEFVEKEKGLECIDWSEGEWKDVKAEIDIIYAWWKNYANRLKEIDDTLEKWSKLSDKAYNRKFVPSDRKDCYEVKEEVIDKNKQEESEKLFHNLTKMETDLKKEETDMLCRLIKIREYLWT